MMIGFKDTKPGKSTKIPVTKELKTACWNLLRINLGVLRV
jgi:hypothetical protein